MDGKKQLTKLIEQISCRHSRWDVFTDWVEMMAISISNAADKVHYEEREKRYLEIVKKYDSNELDKFTEAFACVVDALETNQDQDFLGSLFMELGISNKWKGQFFTPYNVSRMMADMEVGNCRKQIDEQGWISICDPCVGGGAMLIAAANAIHRQAVNYQSHALFVGQDIDRVVGMMAYIQISLLGCPGYIVIGNSLSNPMIGDPLMPREMEGQEFWYTPLYYSEVWHYRRQFMILVSLLASTVTANSPDTTVDSHPAYAITFQESDNGQLRLNL